MSNDSSDTRVASQTERLSRRKPTVKAKSPTWNHDVV